MKRKAKTLTDEIKAKVNPTFKSTFKNCAEQQGTTESQLLRNIVSDYLREKECLK
ncbi:MAG: hypothetical protein Q8936_17130 [Bacillota bacterium]|nr:hypothetical protein [Bacillota bacterium]